MDAQTVNDVILTPALSLLPGRMDTDEARVVLLAIGLQESELAHRKQHGGPATSLWQFEAGGIKGVLRHGRTARYADDLCSRLGYSAEVVNVHQAIINNDLLAAALARLLLWSDNKPLPPIDDAGGAWDLYQRAWNPGRPRREHWKDNHNKAREVIQ